MFGYCRPALCASCHAEEFACLSVPVGEECFWRRMVVPRSCLRCKDHRFGEGYTIKTVVLPARLVADAKIIAAKCEANWLWSMKPANADLQLVNLLAVERDGVRANALMIVGKAAIIDEMRPRGKPLTCWTEFLSIVTCKTLTYPTGTAWVRVKTAKKAAPPAGDAGGSAADDKPEDGKKEEKTAA